MQEKFDYRRMRVRKRMLFLMFAAAHNYAESIYSLCKEGRSHACFVIIRSLIENRINSKSLFSSNSLEGVYGFLSYSNNQHIKALKRQIDLMKSLPHEQIQYHFSEAEFRKKINEIERINVKIARKYPGISRFMALYNRSGEVDEFNRSNNYSSASLKWEYETTYRLYSESIHLTAKGLQNFINIDQHGTIHVFLSGKPEDVSLIAEYVHHLYKDILRMFFLNFRLPYLKKLKSF